MRSDKRKKARKALRYTAWLHLGKGKPRLNCAVADISETGARLDIEAPQDLPIRFILMLSGSGAARRLCRTVWRSSKQVGVQFETPEELRDSARH